MFEPKDNTRKQTTPPYPAIGTAPGSSCWGTRGSRATHAHGHTPHAAFDGSTQ